MKLDRTSMLYGTLLLTATGLVNQLLGFFYRILLSRLITRRSKVQILPPQPEKHLISSEIRCFLFKKLPVFSTDANVMLM